MLHGSCAEALVAAWLMATVHKHWWLHNSWQMCRMTVYCMVHGSVIKLAWMINNLDLARYVLSDKICVQIWNLESMQSVLHLMSSSCSSCKLDKNPNVAGVMFVLDNLS